MDSYGPPKRALDAVVLANRPNTHQGQLQEHVVGLSRCTPRIRQASELMWGRGSVVDPRLHATPEVKRKRVPRAIQCTPRTRLTSELIWGRSRNRAIRTRTCRKCQSPGAPEDSPCERVDVGRSSVTQDQPCIASMPRRKEFVCVAIDVSFCATDLD